MNRFIVSCVIAMLLTACGDNGENNYIGKWVDAKDDCFTMNVAANGKNYLVEIDIPFSMVVKKETLPATVNNGVLEIRNGDTTTQVVFNQKTGTLQVRGGEYKRDTGDKKSCTAKKV